MSSETEFWRWFQSNEDAIFHFEDDQEATFDQLAEALNAVDDALTFEFGPIQDGGRDFVISAAGIKSAFPAVERLVAACPKLERFRVIAFRPRYSAIDDIAIEFGDVTIASSDVYYRFAKDSDPAKLGVLVFLPGYDSETTDFDEIGYLLLDAVLGEYDAETNIGFIEIVGHDSKHFDGARPIHEMAADFDAIMRAKRGT